ncbi:biotin synthase BioB [Falsiporphyromonas endometrii]|uniref:Biotin synthase n=1 Tax=Falsiporphyromonas endometrii TaxID=1387297 RepID=A0ABV9K6R0_9PORP
MIDTLKNKVLRGEDLTEEEAYALIELVQKDSSVLEALYEASHEITEHFNGNRFDTCSIINCKSGQCPENCKWCAQSKFYKTDAEVYSLLDADPCVDLAKHNRKQGINRFAMVASGRKLNNNDTDKVAEIVKKIRQSTDIKCCASLGLMSEDQLQKLYDAGITTYHCNMESAPSYFGSLCSTHTQEDKKLTIEAARKVGMQVCSGGIIGMGESARQRVEFALFLRSLNILSIPINILCPIKGTPLEKQKPLSEDEIFITIAMFRFINPKAYLRFSGGRKQLSDIAQRKAIYIGVNAAITGDMLTTEGEGARHDMDMIREMGKVNDESFNWGA